MESALKEVITALNKANSKREATDRALEQISEAAARVVKATVTAATGSKIGVTRIRVASKDRSIAANTDLAVRSLTICETIIKELGSATNSSGGSPTTSVKLLLEELKSLSAPSLEKSDDASPFIEKISAAITVHDSTLERTHRGEAHVGSAQQQQVKDRGSPQREMKESPTTPKDRMTQGLASLSQPAKKQSPVSAKPSSPAAPVTEGEIARHEAGLPISRPTLKLSPTRKAKST